MVYLLFLPDVAFGKVNPVLAIHVLAQHLRHHNTALWHHNYTLWHHYSALCHHKYPLWHHYSALWYHNYISWNLYSKSGLDDCRQFSALVPEHPGYQADARQQMDSRARISPTALHKGHKSHWPLLCWPRHSEVWPGLGPTPISRPRKWKEGKKKEKKQTRRKWLVIILATPRYSEISDGWPTPSY